MAKTKYIVPAVAMLLCAVSLIGAGYAAYSATLTDNDKVVADNNYVTLELGEHTFSNVEIDLEYVSTFVYTNGASPVATYKPYLANNKVLLGAFSVTADKTNEDTTRTTGGYTLAITNPVCAQQLTGAAITAYTDEAMEHAATLSSLAYGTTYYLAFSYTHNEADNLNAAPGATFNITYTLTATANGMA